MRNKKAVFLIILFIVISIARPLQAASSGQVLLESKVDRTEVTIGDPIHYSLSVTMPKGVELFLPPLGSNLGEFDILDYQMTGPTEKEGQTVQTITYIIAVYDTGTYHIPSVEIGYKTPEGEEKTLSAKEIEIRVKTVSFENAVDVKDIAGPIEMKKDWAPLKKVLLWGTGGFILALLTAWGWWWWRKKRAAGLKAGGPVPLPAHEVACADLKRIWDAFQENRQVREFHFQMSEIIRQYLSRRYRINALEATTEELRREIENQPIPSRHQVMISDFLSGCDLVKFARYTPDSEETQELYQMAFQIVDTTRPCVDATRPYVDAHPATAAGPGPEEGKSRLEPAQEKTVETRSQQG
ncbi:MAG: BatD family protein [bacterium]